MHCLLLSGPLSQCTVRSLEETNFKFVFALDNRHILLLFKYYLLLNSSPHVVHARNLTPYARSCKILYLLTDCERRKKCSGPFLVCLLSNCSENNRRNNSILILTNVKLAFIFTQCK